MHTLSHSRIAVTVFYLNRPKTMEVICQLYARKKGKRKEKEKSVRVSFIMQLHKRNYRQSDQSNR